jgi:hypothetical protein
MELSKGIIKTHGKENRIDQCDKILKDNITDRTNLINKYMKNQSGLILHLGCSTSNN